MRYGTSRSHRTTAPPATLWSAGADSFWSLSTRFANDFMRGNGCVVTYGRRAGDIQCKPVARCLNFFRRWWVFASLWFCFGAGIALGAGYAAQDYQSATTIYLAPVEANPFYSNGERMLAIHFASGAPRKECKNTTQWLLSGIVGGSMVKTSLSVTVNGVRMQADPPFDFWVPVPRYIPEGDWYVHYKTTETCPWLLWNVITMWLSERGKVKIPPLVSHLN